MVVNVLAALAVVLTSAAVVLTHRLASGIRRPPPIDPVMTAVAHTSVSVVVPVRNEAHRLGPCLEGLRVQDAPLRDIIVVDGGSTDGTRELVERAAEVDGRIALLEEPTRDAEVVGRPWALHHGFLHASGEWVMSVDADVVPHAGMIAGAVRAAEAHGLDVLSLGPTIVAPSVAARWLQPAILTTLIYRTGAPSSERRPPQRVLANGQAMLMRRTALAAVGGYRVAARSYCDDVTVARSIAAAGGRVALLDGRRLLDVEMYPTGRETWRAWPRSVNLRDGTTPWRRFLDAALLVSGQALPLPVLIGLLAGGAWRLGLPGLMALSSAAALVVLRVVVLAATAGSFRPRGVAYWLSPLADLPVVCRLVHLMFAAGREWRGAAQAAASEGGFAKQST